ncbi:Helix-turn-helix domain [Mannheimia haemolytica]|uniref:Helix-turn-helix domain n=1 Tax=Mannheimia haemolytica TaxID=75985 RepID=A0A378MU32_MANHA|nr:Helix-turn-helix domain [Mannheimia haemolytica]
MLLRKPLKFEIRPNGEQVRKMKQFCGCSRFVFNKALAWQNEQYEQDNHHKFSYTKLANLLPQWKKELVWLKDCHSQVLQQSLKDLESAFKNFFQKRADLPKFKKKGVKRVSVFRKVAKSSRKTTACICRKSVGCVIATVVKLLGK